LIVARYRYLFIVALYRTVQASKYNKKYTKKSQKPSSQTYCEKRILSCILCILSCGNTFVLHVSMCS